MVFSGSLYNQKKEKTLHFIFGETLGMHPSRLSSNNMFLNKNSPVNTSDNLDDRKYAYEKCL